MNIQICNQTYNERTEYEIPSLQSVFSNNVGVSITVRMDKTYEFLALDFFGQENIKRVDNDIYITFCTEHTEWVISTFASLGEKAEIIAPKALRNEIKTFLAQAQKLYEI